jgi:outer membrane receptor for ferrienterochelin and colicins
MGFNHKRFALSLILVISVICECIGQNRIISGKVIDFNTNIPIPGVEVRLKGVENSSISSDNGYYELKVPENTSKIEFVDFSEKKVSKLEKISKNEFNIYLSDNSRDEIYKLSLAELMNVKVNVASKVTESVTEAPGVVSVVTAKEIEAFGATSLRDILERVTGIFGFTGFGNRNVINLRGDQLYSSSKHILILINGRPTRERIASGEDMEVYAMFPINTIEQIEVIRGPGSVLYGTNAFTGVINIITKQRKEYLSAEISGASPAANIASVEGATHIGAGMLSGGLYYKNLQDWEQSFTTELGADTSFNTHEKGIGINLGYTIGGFKVNTDLIVLNNFIVNTRLGGDYGDFTRHFVDIGYTHQFSKKVRFTINVTNTYYYYDGFPLQPKRTSNDFLTEVATYYTPNVNLNVIFGGIVNNISGIVKRLANNEVVATMPWYNQNQYTFYSQADYRLNNSLKVIGGFQLNKHSKDVPTKFAPRLGLVWNPTEKVVIKSLYAEAFRAPSAAETASKDQNRIGNPQLKPEYVHSFDVEFRYLEKKIQPSLVFFIYKQYNNVAIAQTVPKQFINRGEFSAKGLEFELKYMPTSNLYFTGSSSYQTNLLNDSIKNTSTGAVTAKLGVSYNFDFGLSMGVFNIYNSKPPDVVWNNPNRQLVNPVPQAFNLLSANLNYNLSKVLKLNRAKIILNLRAENLLNEEIFNPEWYLSGINSIPGKPGRRIYFGVKINL